MKNLICCCMLAISGLAHAEFEVFRTVPSTAGPWNSTGSLNSGLAYGTQDHSAPIRVGIEDGFDMSEGRVMLILYVKGLTSPFGGTPYCNGLGDPNYPANDALGSSGQVFPSKYMDPGSYPINLAAMVGCFTDFAGSVIGQPFAVGNGTLAFVPAGATHLQLGFNDDIFRDNTGEIEVEVEGTPVPEPASLLALGGFAAFVLRRSRKD